MTGTCNGVVLNQCTGKISSKNGAWVWEGNWNRADNNSDSGTFTSQKVDDAAPQRFQEQERAVEQAKAAAEAAVAASCPSPYGVLPVFRL
jgi:ornithine carbamoyltransferase